MKRSKYNSFNELPLMLTVQDVADVLGIGLAHAYEVAHRQDFPHYHLGQPDHRPPRQVHGVDRRAGGQKDGNILVAISKILWYLFVLSKGGMNNGKETSKR